MRRFKVTVKCYGWLLSTCFVDAANEIAAYHEAKRLHLEFAEKLHAPGISVEPSECVEVAS